MGGTKGLGALVGLKIVCCGGLLLVASGAVAATQLAWGAALLLTAVGASLLIRHRRQSAQRGVRAVDSSRSVSSQTRAAARTRLVGGSARR